MKLPKFAFRSWSRRRVYVVCLALSGAVLIAIALAQPQQLEALSNHIFDSFQRISPRRDDGEGPVRVVAIDERSLATFGQWPWPRTRLAELTKKLTDLGAAAIVYDFIFAEPDRMSLENIIDSVPEKTIRKELTQKLNETPSNDRIFAESIGAGPVILGTTLIQSVDPGLRHIPDSEDKVEGGTTESAPQKAGFVTAGDDPKPFVPSFPAIVSPLPVLFNAATGIGATNWLADRDQVVRRIPLFVLGPLGLTPSLALEALRVAQGASTYVIRSSNASGQSAFGEHTGINAVKVGEVEIATGAHSDIRPHYRHWDPRQTISAATVLENRVPRSEIEGRIVFVGASAIGLSDIRATPLDSSIPGVEIHGQIVESILQNKLLSRPDWAPGFEFVLAIVSFVGIGALLLVAPPFLALLLSLAWIGTLFAGSFLLFEHDNILVDPGQPSLGALSAFGIGTLALWSFERVAKRSVHQAFGKFLAPAVVDQLISQPERLVLGGETRELTVLFSDLRNFSSLSEGLSAPELTSFMNDYLTPMTDTILEFEGTVDKYIGDAIVAFWNAPIDVPEHPQKAVAAALRMRSALADLNQARAAKARESNVAVRPVVMGIGINLGPCNVGNMGSIRRFDYSILGDTVNLASRLEGACKTFGVDLIVSSVVQRAAPDFAWLDLGEVIVKGRKTPTAIFTAVGDQAAANNSEFIEWKRMHDDMLRAYARQKFAEAAEQAGQLASHVVPPWQELYFGLKGRYAELEKANLNSDWSPVWALEQK
jgi:adenylate cyclase